MFRFDLDDYFRHYKAIAVVFDTHEKSVYVLQCVGELGCFC
jgi:hypothetical protein